MPTLNLLHFTILNTQETEHDIMLNVEYTEQLAFVRNTEARRQPSIATTPRNMFFDFPTQGKRRKLCVRYRRFKCADCGALFFQRLAGIDDKLDMTNRLVAWIGPESLAISFSMTAHNLGCADVTVRNIFMEHAERKTKELNPRS